MEWLVDTSAWARRDQPAVSKGLRQLLDDGDVFVLSPTVLLELLRGPQGAAVADERSRLTAAMAVVEADAKTFELAADAMECLAAAGAEAHRKPIADLLTAALAHQHELGVVHCDNDFDDLRAKAGLEFSVKQLAVEAADDEPHDIAAKQRALRRELAQLLHRAPAEKAEELLERAVVEARELIEE